MYCAWSVPLSGTFSYLSNSISQCLACAESRKFHGRDFDLLIRVSRADAFSGGSLGNSECAETGDGYIVTFSERFRYCFENCVECLCCRLLGNVSGLCGRIYQILFCHVWFVLGGK